MGLDVGVVTIEYSPDPQPPVYGFLYDLLLNPYTGVDEDDDDDIWGDSWTDNGVYEFERVGLTSRAINWANDHAISESEKDDLLSWVADLPWRNDMVTLHLGR